MHKFTSSFALLALIGCSSDASASAVTCALPMGLYLWQGEQTTGNCPESSFASVIDLGAGESLLAQPECESDMSVAVDEGVCTYEGEYQCLYGNELGEPVGLLRVTGTFRDLVGDAEALAGQGQLRISTTSGVPFCTGIYDLSWSAQ